MDERAYVVNCLACSFLVCVNFLRLNLKYLRASGLLRMTFTYILQGAVKSFRYVFRYNN